MTANKSLAPLTQVCHDDGMETEHITYETGRWTFKVTTVLDGVKMSLRVKDEPWRDGVLLDNVELGTRVWSAMVRP